MPNHVFALIGESGSGKTTLQYSMSKLLTIPKGITTRGYRIGDVANQYLYPTIEEMVEFIKNDELILLNLVYRNMYAYRKCDFDKGHSIVVVDVVGLRQLQEEFGFENVTGIFIEAPLHLKIERMGERGKEKAQARIDSDKVKFHNAYHLCDYKITNDRDIKSAKEELYHIVYEVLTDKGYI